MTWLGHIETVVIRSALTNGPTPEKVSRSIPNRITATAHELDVHPIFVVSSWVEYLWGLLVGGLFRAQTIPLREISDVAGKST